MVKDLSSIELKTKRFMLNALTLADVERIEELTADSQVARYAPIVPESFPRISIPVWIVRNMMTMLEGKALTLGIRLLENGELAGVVAVSFSRAIYKAELSIWLGTHSTAQQAEFEICHAVCKFAFESYNLNKITARHASKQPNIKAALLRLGMRAEGRLRQEYRYDYEWQDVIVYGLLQQDFVETPEI
ncbi:MAG: N-acetyltransferase [Proteobacteria bacterium]|nr:MAG: N-acetyltransferase [Pseudomonadota bacterium]